ncbi:MULTISPECIES: type II secretion system protein [unclassified Moorena]|uniref:pilus assembly FimT family protein n=1 Tax=unclassified Moorena TaxID=2683338 RepID=UPI0013B7A43B|nr:MULTISPECIES: type II secretion system protein [unclassified Moorena]NEQ17808.1 type II secretion system protein [Moorena sp. SIO3E2]NER89853.1 type II secretion system protein [Moorena sp. SIO3A2]NES41938.1 type II secretion system protein [Moorena sp. SIO2C4]
MQFNSQQGDQSRAGAIAGFTLLETILIVLVVGILAAIATPSWLTFINHLQLNIAQDEIYRAMRIAQSNAKRDKATWQTSFREQDGIVQWSIHRAMGKTCILDQVHWHSLSPTIAIYKDKNKKGKSETTLAKPKGDCSNTGPWRVQFNHKGNTNGQLGQITLITKNNNNNITTQRCVYVSTLIGALRKGRYHPKPNNSKKYCY